MILLAAEVWAILACCFLAGGGLGWLLSRGLRPLVSGFAPRRRRGDDDDMAAVPVPLPERVPVIVPLPRREAGAVTIDAVPARPHAQEGGSSREPPAAMRPRAALPARIRPPALAGPRQGRADALTRIGGLTRRHADRLYAIGIYHFSQIAAWTPREAAWITDYLALGDELDEQDWIGQAARLAAMSGPRRPAPD